MPIDLPSNSIRYLEAFKDSKTKSQADFEKAEVFADIIELNGLVIYVGPEQEGVCHASDRIGNWSKIANIWLRESDVKNSDDQDTQGSKTKQNLL